MTTVEVLLAMTHTRIGVVTKTRVIRRSTEMTMMAMMKLVVITLSKGVSNGPLRNRTQIRRQKEMSHLRYLEVPSVVQKVRANLDHPEGGSPGIGVDFKTEEGITVPEEDQGQITGASEEETIIMVVAQDSEEVDVELDMATRRVILAIHLVIPATHMAEAGEEDFNEGVVIVVDGLPVEVETLDDHSVGPVGVDMAPIILFKFTNKY